MRRMNPSSNKVEPWRRRLFLPAYAVSDAARYAGTSPRTVAYWHHGGQGLGPALPRREHRKPLSYLQLIELAFVATFRQLGVSLQRIRKAREYLCQTFNSEFPFAELRLQTEGSHILLELEQAEEEVELGRLIIADASGQIAWQSLVGDRFAQFDYTPDGLAITWHPAGRQSPITIDPRISFGAPTVRGIPTWAVKWRWVAGESVGDITKDFGLEEKETIQALAFEGLSVAA